MPPLKSAFLPLASGFQGGMGGGRQRQQGGGGGGGSGESLYEHDSNIQVKGFKTSLLGGARLRSWVRRTCVRANLCTAAASIIALG